MGLVSVYPAMIIMSASPSRHQSACQQASANGSRQAAERFAAQLRAYLRVSASGIRVRGEVVLGDRKRNFELTLCDLLAAPSTPDAARHR